MSQITINDLNNEVLLEIFEYLDGYSLKQCCETQRLWNVLISSTASIMKKMPLTVNNSKSRKSITQELKKNPRNFYSANLEKIKITCTVVNSMARQLNHIKILDISDLRITEAAFKNLLRNIKSLEKLSLTYVELAGIQRKKNSAIDLQDLPSLKSLTIYHSELKLFDYIGKTELQELKIVDEDYHAVQALKTLEKFLKLQIHLETLGLCVGTPSIYEVFENNDERNYKFQLKKVSLGYKYWGENDADDQSVVNLLSQHKHTIKFLEILGNKSSEKIVEFIMKHLSLETLILSAKRLPTTTEFYSDILPNKFLKELIFKGPLQSVIVASEFFRIYPNIRTLSIENILAELEDNVMIEIISNMKHLNQLKLLHEFGGHHGMQMQSLKTLRIQEVRDAVEFQAFVINQVNVENLLVDRTNTNINGAIVAISSQLKNIKRLSIGFGPKLTHRTLQMLKQNCPGIHTIEMLRKNNETQGAFNDINGNGLRVFEYTSSSLSHHHIFKKDKTLWCDDDLDDLFDLNSTFDEDWNDDYYDGIELDFFPEALIDSDFEYGDFDDQDDFNFFFG